eukprot:XP_025982895.1 uncharacterized protein LOC102670263 [Glycine max]
MLNEVEAEVETDGYHSEELNIPISSDDEDEDVEVYPQYSQSSGVGEQKLELGMEFGTLDEFKSALREYSILMGREFKWKKNDKQRARAKCKKAFCDWEIYCAKNEVRNSFQIKTFKHNHNCCREVNNKQANRQWVVSKLEGKLRMQPTLKCVEALEYFKQEFGVHIEVTKMWRAMKEAKQLVEGNERKQYAKVFDYAHELLRSNPGSTVKINTVPSPEGPPQFQRLYICLAGCKKGFVAGCRPFIGLDGCFLKSAFGGNLLSAVGLDGNNHIYVIAYAVVDIENKDNWKWFLTLLHEDLGDYIQNGWNFMSDMQKGLIPALQEVMPGAPHRFCVLHLWKNFTKQWKSKELKGIVWQCAKSTTVAEFEGHMAHLKTINCQAWEYLNKWPKQAWTKAHFSTTPKVDNICNNTCEVFNSRILQYRCKPIITMLEEIRSYIMRTMAARKVKLSGKPGPLCPVQYKRLEKEFHFANQWTPIWCGDNMGLRYEVHMWGNKVEVNLGEWTCTCGVWQLTGMPCRHAIATITHKGGKPEDMCHEWLSIEAYNKTYQHFIEPVQGPQYWAQTQYTHPVPPHKKVQRGRPKKNRRRSVDEDNVTGHKLKRKLAEFTCGRCGQTNHNIRSCKNIGVPVRPKKYVAPSTSNEDDHLLSQDEQALNEAEEAVAHVQQDPVEINLSQPHLSQDSDMEVPATIVPPIARNKLAITIRIAARLPWWHYRMKLPENAQQLPLADMDKSSEQAAGTEPQRYPLSVKKSYMCLIFYRFTHAKSCLWLSEKRSSGQSVLENFWYELTKPPSRAQPQEGEPAGDSSRFSSEIVWHMYQDNVHLWNILPERNVELAPTMFDEFYGELQHQQWHHKLTCLLEKRINVALVYEFYTNAYNPEDGSPKYCRVQEQVIQFDVETLNDFLETPVIILEGEEYPTYSQYLHSYPNH